MSPAQTNDAIEALARIGTTGQLSNDYRLVVCTLRGISLDDEAADTDRAPAFNAANGTWALVSSPSPLSGTESKAARCTCGLFCKIVERAPNGESGDIFLCARCDAAELEAS